MSYLFLILIAAGGVFAFFAWLKIHQASQEIDRLFKTNQTLETKVRQQAVEIQQKNAEVNNAKIFRKNEEHSRRSTGKHIDEQLQQHGWFREGEHHGVQCVRSDLRQSCGHDGDKASDFSSQSDL